MTKEPLYFGQNDLQNAVSDHRVYVCTSLQQSPPGLSLVVMWGSLLEPSFFKNPDSNWWDLEGYSKVYLPSSNEDNVPGWV